MIKTYAPNQNVKAYYDILRDVALGGTGERILNDLCKVFEAELSKIQAKCAILELMGEQIFHSAAPSLPSQFCDQLDGLFVASDTTTIGKAIINQSPAFEANISTSLLWLDYQAILEQTPFESCFAHPFFAADGRVLGAVAIYLDRAEEPTEEIKLLVDSFATLSGIAVQRIAQQLKVDSFVDTLTKSNQKFRAFTKVMPDLALIMDAEGRYEDVHGSPDSMIYLSATEIVNKKISDLFAEEEANKFLEVIDRTLKTNKIQVYEYAIPNPDGVGEIVFEGRVTPLHYDDDTATSAKHVLWMARDITKEKSVAEKIEQLAFYDPLTNLPNRRMFNERLKLAVESNKAASSYGAILFFDLDKFKRINDSLGHQAGDYLLKDVSERLKKSLRRSDILARIGGDEFVLLLEHIGETEQESIEEVGLVAKKIQDAFSEKFTIDKLAFQVSCSIGICFIDGNISADDILKFADTAMYASKRKGGNSFSFYDPHQQTLLNRQVNFESEIVSAIEQNQFCAYFQPQTNIDGKVIGAEALIRWVHPTRGLIAPYEFIPVAEQYSLIQSLQNVVLADICEVLNELEDSQQLQDDFKISINISHSQFKSSDFKKSLLDVTDKYNVSPSLVMLEITESMLAHDINNTVEQMKEIADVGFSFSIDDFGTGYSSLSHLHAFPVAELKIDKSFVDRMHQPSGLSIVDTIASLAKSLKMDVVAEGVEEASQIDILKNHQIDILQGYLISKPMPKKEFLDWHRQREGNVNLAG